MMAVLLNVKNKEKAAAGASFSVERRCIKFNDSTEIFHRQQRQKRYHQFITHLPFPLEKGTKSFLRVYHDRASLNNLTDVCWIQWLFCFCIVAD